VATKEAASLESEIIKALRRNQEQGVVCGTKK
jgi:hypothetical protein